jgi:hypothetical protein
MQILKQLTIKENLISFGVESLFAMVPIHDTLDIVRQHITAADLPRFVSSLIEHCQLHLLRPPGELVATHPHSLGSTTYVTENG